METYINWYSGSSGTLLYHVAPMLNHKIYGLTKNIFGLGLKDASIMPAFTDEYIDSEIRMGKHLGDDGEDVYGVSALSRKAASCVELTGMGCSDYEFSGITGWFYLFYPDRNESFKVMLPTRNGNIYVKDIELGLPFAFVLRSDMPEMDFKEYPEPKYNPEDGFDGGAGGSSGGSAGSGDSTGGSGSSGGSGDGAGDSGGSSGGSGGGSGGSSGGSAGNDHYTGGAGNNDYRFNLGDGWDSISDVGGVDTIIFGEGIRLEDIYVQIVGGNLVIGIYEEGKSFEEYFNKITISSGSNIENIRFSDGSVYGFGGLSDFMGGLGSIGGGTGELGGIGGSWGGGASGGGAGVSNLVYKVVWIDAAMSARGSEFDDTITTGSNNDILAGGWGNDTLRGGNGDDTYIFNRGDGHDIIEDSGGRDKIVFGEGITKGDVYLIYKGSSDVIVGLKEEGKAFFGISDWVINKNFRTPSSNGQIEEFVFFDDGLLTFEELLAVLGAETPNITVHPHNKSYNEKAEIVLSVTAEVTDGGELTYQWYLGDYPGMAIYGANGDTYTPPLSAGTSYYYLVVTNSSLNEGKKAYAVSDMVKVSAYTISFYNNVLDYLGTFLLQERELPLSEVCKDESWCSQKWHRAGETVPTATHLLNGDINFYAVQDVAEIYTEEEFNNVRGNLGGKYILFSDIALTDATLDKNTGWTPIGGFTGIFNGNGHKITGLFIKQKNINTLFYYGLFGTVSGKLSNLGVELTETGIDINGYNGYAGGIAGLLEGGSISRSYVTGNIKIYCDSCNEIIAGGIAGRQTSGTISNTYFNGSAGVRVETIRHWDSSAGGIVGEVVGSASVSTSYSTAEIRAGPAPTHPGGIVGRLGLNFETGHVINCVALNENIIGNTVYQGRRLVVLGEISSSVTGYARADMLLTGSPISSDSLRKEDGTSKDLEELKLQTTYEELDWNFGQSGTTPIWKMPESGSNYEYPILYWQKSPPHYEVSPLESGGEQ
jgi:hypothetical protein